jgi:hypothetical protein
LLQRDEIIRWLRDVYGNQVSGVGNGAIFSTCFSPTYGNDKTYLKQGAGNGPTSAIRANGSPDLGAIVIDASGASVQQKKAKEFDIGSFYCLAIFSNGSFFRRPGIYLYRRTSLFEQLGGGNEW